MHPTWLNTHPWNSQWQNPTVMIPPRPQRPNEVLWNQSNSGQTSLNGTVLISTAQAMFKQVNGMQLNLSSSTHDKRVPTNTSKPISTEPSSRRHVQHSLNQFSGTRNRSFPRPAHTEAVPTQSSTPLTNSHSLETALDRIGRERRSHTMAPSTRILGPSSTLKAKLFASAAAPIDPKREINARDDHPRDSDDAPIIVKVRYDPNAGGLPSEDLVRLAIDRKLAQQSDKRIKQESIVINFLGQKGHPPKIPSVPMPTKQQQHNHPSRTDLPAQRSTNHPSLRIPLVPELSQPRLQMPPADARRVHPMFPLPSVPPTQRPPQPFPRVDHHRFVQARQPPANRQQAEPMMKQREPTNISVPTGFNRSRLTKPTMATEQRPIPINSGNARNVQQGASSSAEMFRPPAVSDIPELSKANLLTMLNQIPDLQGRHFNIEYALSSAPNGYPIPSNSDAAHQTYPDPVVVDQLPTNVIQHVKTSNNRALAAALDAAIQRDQKAPSAIGQPQAMRPTLNVQASTLTHHATQNNQQVHESRPVSSKDSESSTEVSSSETSSSEEETDSDESESKKPSNNMPLA